MATYIDVTPTWESMVPVLVHLAVEGQTAQARQTAMAELLRAARIADTYLADRKRGIRLPPLEIWGPFNHVVPRCRPYSTVVIGPDD